MSQQHLIHNASSGQSLQQRQLQAALIKEAFIENSTENEDFDTAAIARMQVAGNNQIETSSIQSSARISEYQDECTDHPSHQNLPTAAPSSAIVSPTHSPILSRDGAGNEAPTQVSVTALTTGSPICRIVRSASITEQLSSHAVAPQKHHTQPPQLPLTESTFQHALGSETMSKEGSRVPSAKVDDPHHHRHHHHHHHIQCTDKCTQCLHHKHQHEHQIHPLCEYSSQHPHASRHHYQRRNSSSSTANHRLGQPEEKKKRRFSYSKARVAAAVPPSSPSTQSACATGKHDPFTQPHDHHDHHRSYTPEPNHPTQTGEIRKNHLLDSSNPCSPSSSASSFCHELYTAGSMGNNNSLRLFVDPTSKKCCMVRAPSAGLSTIGPNQKTTTATATTTTAAAMDDKNDLNNDIGIHSTVKKSEQQGQGQHPLPVEHHSRVVKMLNRHPAVKLEWKVPETIKAAGEILRGVLIVSVKELSVAEMKKMATKTNKVAQRERGQQQHEDGPLHSHHHHQHHGGKRGKDRLKYDRIVRIKHAEIDLTGVEEVSTGGGILSRSRTDHHCFLHKTQGLPVEEFKWIQDTPLVPLSIGPLSTSTSVVASSTASSISTSASTAPETTTGSISTSSTASSIASDQQCSSNSNSSSGGTTSSPSPTTLTTSASAASAVPDAFEPGCVVPGTRQGIPFQMRVPEKVGGVFKSAHASISYQLTAKIHFQIGREEFVLQHPMSVSLFELVQIRAATKVASPHDLSPAGKPSNSTKKSSVRFVIPKANSVLGTAAVKPYSLWGLGPATSSHSSHYQYSNSHGYGRYHHQNQNQNQNHQQTQRRSSYHRQNQQVIVASREGEKDSYSSSDVTQGLTTSVTATETVERIRFHDNDDDHHHYHNNNNYNVISGQQGNSATTTRKHTARKASLDGSIDEVGFGAHIDKSVAAAGDNITLDMFVVKSDLMRVVDIKVSLVETINIYSLIDGGTSGGNDGGQQDDGHGHPVRKLVDSYMVKIAKDYVPAQAEENHANDNHLKGYYEDYEDFRTTKSLSMYKLGMHIPETALTILERELLKVDYMFVIKFFFKGRMGAFLELPIEIVSQYNHNRISTISGAISCVSNSVHIALPPVPILIKRSESTRADLDECAAGVVVRSPSESNAAGAFKVNSQDVTLSSDNKVAMVTVSGETISETLQSPREQRHPGLLQKLNVDCPRGEGRVQAPAGEQIKGSSKLTGTEVKTCTKGDDSVEAAVPGSALAVDISKSSPLSSKDGTKVPPANGVLSTTIIASPRIVVQSAQSSPKLSSSITNVASQDETTTVVTSALPLLFDLTSAVLPSPTTAAAIDGTLGPRRKVGDLFTGGRRGSVSGSDSISVPISSGRPMASQTSGTTLLVGAHGHEGDAPVVSSNTSSSGMMDPVLSNINSGLVAKLAKSFSSSPLLRSRGGGGAGGASPIGSNSNLASISNNPISPSQQQQQTSAFTLAATTFSALTLLSSVGQPVVTSTAAASSLSEPNYTVGVTKRSHTFPHPSYSQAQTQHSPPRPLKSCLKKKKSQTVTGTTLSANAAIQQQERTIHGRSGRTLQANSKKVSFAKGSTPSPSPTGSQTFTSSSSSSSMSSSSSEVATGNASGDRKPTTTLNNDECIKVVNNQQHRIPMTALQKNMPDNNSTAKMMIHQTVVQSPKTGRLLHPFDGHPSRLSTLEKQHLDNHLFARDPHHLRQGQPLGQAQHQQQRALKNCVVDNGLNDDDDNDNDNEEEYDEVDIEDNEEFEEEEEDDFEDDENEEKETEEERIERRRLARVAWLAKYGDAFKQVYGAVPELPPI
ncbi:hypothetical protein BG004_007194 [Podila humilis]|nr:hypothetical protein BG004_007194 [Podila humilis]